MLQHHLLKSLVKILTKRLGKLTQGSDRTIAASQYNSNETERTRWKDMERKSRLIYHRPMLTGENKSACQFSALITNRNSSNSWNQSQMCLTHNRTNRCGGGNASFLHLKLRQHSRWQTYRNNKSANVTQLKSAWDSKSKHQTGQIQINCANRIFPRV